MGRPQPLVCATSGPPSIEANFERAVARLDGHGVALLSPVATDEPGTALEQTKVKFADPSGNVIELKTYVDVAAALEISEHDAGASDRGD